MTISWQHHLDVAISRSGRVRRRDFLRGVSAAALAAGAASWTDTVAAQADALRKQNRACILLWMQGGPSQFETWDPKVGHSNGGETKSISTAVPGVRIASTLPETAKVMEDVCLIRSMNSREGSHPRASYLMHTGYLPTASVKYPSLGAHAAHQLGEEDAELPSFVRVGRSLRNSTDAGLLGVEYSPFVVQDPRNVPSNTEVQTTDDRFRRRLGLLGKLESSYSKDGGKQAVVDHKKLYGKASRMVLSPKMNVFDLEREPQKTREAYGDSQFGQGCLLARRLVESGVTFVEVTSSNWDTHQDNFSRTKELGEEVDRPYAQLLMDLKQRGMLDNTLVLWMGEFGRTPRVNGRDGRDHYPRAFSVAMAGGGVRGGQVIGSTDRGGVDIAERPVGVNDLLRTCCHSLNIDADLENMSSIGRPIRVIDDGEVVDEVFG